MLAAEAARAQDFPPDDLNARLSLIPAQTAIAAGETVPVAIRQDIRQGWHTYWINAGDSGEMMRVDWTLPAGFTAGALEWPVPEKIINGPLVSYGYHNEATILTAITAPADFAGGAVTIGATITTLVCAEICIPETSTHTLTFNDGPNGQTKAGPALIAAARTHMPAAYQGPVTMTEDNGELVLSGLPPLPPDGTLLPHDWGLIDNMAASSTVNAPASTTIRHKRGDRPLRAVREARFVWGHDQGGLAFLAVNADQAADSTDTSDTSDRSNPVKTPDTSFPLALILAFAGGMVLNLMPCVFPVLFMKALSLCHIAHHEEREVRIQAWLYTAGIVLSFTAVAGALVALRAAGAQIGWGFQLQNPLVIMILVYLFFIIGLNLSGFFEISSRFAGLGQSLLGKGGKHGHSFFLGVLAVLVATPCTAPFMGVAMGYALTQPAPTALSIFITLGLGLSFPYLLLSYVPSLRRALPRPGAWMETFRRILAIPMFLTVAWLVWVYGQQTQAAWLIVTGLVLITCAAALWRKTGTAARTLTHGAATLLLLAAAALGVFGFVGSAGQPGPAPETAAHSIYDETRLDNLLSAGKPVFVNMTADWCITCKVNERVALRTADFAAHGVTYMVGDWTKQDPAITAYLARFNRNGVPLYVYYGPRTKDGHTPEPVVLPQILTPGLIAKTLSSQP